jgi:hypothetical protein
VLRRRGELTWRGSYDVQVAARPKWTAGFVPTAPPVTEKAPEQSGQADARMPGRESDPRCGSCEDPVLEWRRPGGSVSAVMRQG